MLPTTKFILCRQLGVEASFSPAKHMLKAQIIGADLF